MTRPSPNVLHMVDSLGIGGTQAILKGFFEARPGDRSVHLYGMRAVPRPMQITHSNVSASRSTLRFSVAPLLELRKIVRERAIDVLHCHLFRAQVFGFALKRLFFPRIKLIFHEHGRAVGREGESRLEALMFRWFLRLAWHRVDRFICNSDHTRAHLLHLIPGANDRTTVVANPIPIHPCKDETRDREALRRAQAIPDGAFVVGFASRLVQRKGWDDFIGAIAQLAPVLPVYFLIAGDGEDRDKVEARIRALGLHGRGRMLGHIDWMERFYIGLDCFVMPSHWEPHGLAHLEAQGFGVPVIVASVPGLGSTVHADRDALLFKAGDVRALAECIRRLAVDPGLRARLVAAGIANADRYGMDVFSANLEQVYSSIPGQREPVGGA